MVDSTNLPEVDINQIATDLNDKMDRDGVNASCPTLLSRTANNQGGIVEIWSDGYCVQTGSLITTSSATITFDKSFIDNTYQPILTVGETNPVDVWGDKPTVILSGKTATTMQIYLNPRSGGYPTRTVFWEAKGYIR